MFAWVMATPLSARYVQKQSAEVFYKKAALENTVLKSFFNKVTGLQANFAIFFRTPILKNIC